MALIKKKDKKPKSSGKLKISVPRTYVDADVGQGVRDADGLAQRQDPVEHGAGTVVRQRQVARQRLPPRFTLPAPERKRPFSAEDHSSSPAICLIALIANVSVRPQAIPAIRHG